MSTLPENSLMKGIFAQSLTGNYSSIPMDLWIEMIMNKGSKMKARWEKILQNETMLLTQEMLTLLIKCVCPYIILQT